MNKNVIFLAIAALLIGAGVAVLVAQQSSNDVSAPAEETATTQTEEEPLQPGDEAEVAENNVVTYTDEGFAPDQATVQSGETVTFENNSSFDLWVASDEHPAHTELPEFDAGRGISPGEVYTFTFTEPGEWGYHNHLQANQTGVVVVE